MRQILRELLQRASIYVAVTLPHPMTISLMSRLNGMPYNGVEQPSRFSVDHDDPNE